MMAALAGVVHNREGASGPEHNYGQDNQQWVLHGDLAKVPDYRPPNYRGSNEPNVNAGHRLPHCGLPHRPSRAAESG